MLIVNAAQASGVSQAGDVAAWRACQDKTADSTETKRLEDNAGRTAVIELVHKKCGFRPTVVRDNGYVGLDEKACTQLFEWSKDGSCSLEDTVAQDLYIRTLNPEVFNSKKYSARCMGNQSAGRVDNYQSFRKEIRRLST